MAELSTHTSNACRSRQRPAGRTYGVTQWPAKRFSARLERLHFHGRKQRPAIDGQAFAHRVADRMRHVNHGRKRRLACGLSAFGTLGVRFAALDSRVLTIVT